MNKTTEALKLAEEAAEFARNMCLGMNWSTDLPDEALAAIREVLAESKPAPDGRIPKTVFMLDDISKAAEMGRQAGMIDALAEPVIEHSVEVGYVGEFVAPTKSLPAGTPLCVGPVQPVKQGPVAWLYDAKLTSGYQMYWKRKFTFEKPEPGRYTRAIKPLYAAPVDAKAIRAEALEEAAKWFEDEEHPLQPKKVAAAIRGLK